MVLPEEKTVARRLRRSSAMLAGTSEKRVVDMVEGGGEE